MIALEIIAFVILTIPTVFELWQDRNGESVKKKRLDIFWRLLSFSSSAIVSGWVIYGFRQTPFIYYLKAGLMSFAIFFLIFDYCIHAILIHRGIIETKESAFTYTGKTSEFDKFSLWVRIGPWGRFAVKMAVFIGALIWYF